MVIRNDFLYYVVDNLRFKHIIGICTYSDNYLNGLVENFNRLDYREYFKYNSNLTLENAKYSINKFIDNLNFNRYDVKIKNGVVNWNIGNNIIIGFNYENENNNCKKLINNEYLKEWKNYGFYYYKE